MERTEIYNKLIRLGCTLPLYGDRSRKAQ